MPVDWLWWPINVRIRWIGGRCANDDWAEPQASAPAEFSYLQFPPCPEPGSSTFWSFVHIFQHTAPSLAGLNAQARDRFGHFQRRTIGFQLGKWGAGLSVSRDILSGWVTGLGWVWMGKVGTQWDHVALQRVPVHSSELRGTPLHCIGKPPTPPVAIARGASE